MKEIIKIFKSKNEKTLREKYRKLNKFISYDDFVNEEFSKVNKGEIK